MASYTVAAGNVSKHATLVAATVDTVTFTDDVRWVAVLNRSATSTDIISFTVDGSVPTALGDNTFVVPAGAERTVPIGTKSDAVKLISATTPAYSVTGLV